MGWRNRARQVTLWPMRIAPLSAVILALLPLACTSGSGVKASEVRASEAFEAIEVGGALTVDVEVGPQTRVEVQGDDNLVSKVRTVVEGKTLHIDLSGSVSTELPLVIHVATPSLHELDVGGASTVDVRGIVGERFEVDLSGASTVELRGEVEDLDAEASGASTLRAAALVVQEAEVEASGASKVEVNAARSLDASASGASTIRYQGQPGELQRDVSGASKIEASG